MSVFDRLAPLIPQVSASCRQTKEHPKVCVSPPVSLSSPVIKKKAIQIPSFDEKGLIFEKHNTKLSAAERSFDSVCSLKTTSQASWSKSCPQRNHRERASTLPRTKPKTYSPPSLSGKPSISIFPATKPNSSPTLPTLKPRQSDFLHLPASQLSDPPPSLQQPKPSVSPTLTVPTPRLSPSPMSTCQGMSSDGQGGKQPFPVAKERRARSIPISNPKAKPFNEVKHDILDQDTLLDFTHPEARKVCPATSRESPHQTYSESYRLPATSQNPCFLQSRFGINKGENIVKDQPKTPPRNIGITAIPKPKSNIKQQQESEPSEVTDTQTSVSERIKSVDTVHRESDGPASQSSFQRKCADYNQRSNNTQSPNFTSSHQSHEQMCSEKGAASPVTSKRPFFTDSLLSPSAVSPNIEGRRRRFDLHNETQANTTFLSGPHPRRPQEENKVQTIAGSLSKASQQTGAHQNIKSLQKYRFSLKTQSQTTQMDVKSAVRQFDCVSKDYSCQSRDIDQKAEASRCAHRLNRLKTCLVAPQTQGASGPASIERIASHTGNFSKPGLRSQEHPLSQDRSPGPHKKSHKEVKASDTGLNQTDILAPPDHHAMPTKLLEYPSEKYVASWTPSVALCPFNTNRFGISSTGAFDLLSQPQHRVYQKAEETTTTTTAPLPTNQLNHSVVDSAFVTEESEDPYYVTMYYPGSVYVDMSDVVPPEVRPKPAVPAKPPNVGAPSPSSPFPPQGPGVGGGGVSAPPPSGIPVPIGSHGPSHIGGHGVGHGVGHGAGHAGSHPAAHSGGHSHGGSHSTSGGSTLLGYIGIDTIIEQMRKKTMKTGFDFNIMVVGHSGLGKSTLINTLFKSQVSRRSAGWARDEKIPKTVEIKAVSHVIEEGGVKMKLTVVDTPGFGDQINNDNCWEPISKYINEQYEKFLKEEVNITRKKRIPDTRMHCCIYFISPTGHSLRQLDLEFMKRLSHSVNIIPVIAKADTMTIEERQEFKQRVRKELEMSGIEFYPQKEFDEDMEDKSDNDKIREAMPFAVVGSDKEYQVNGKRVLGRKTAWGIVEVENPNHCEFAQLRDFLIRSHLQDLKEVTHNIHYETYRAKRLNENGGLHPISSNDTQESNL
ncbi:neuronal-specific septin-3 isoform X1 [Stegastes partitus]|uniref:Neuronal-specific septin-3 n=2 Tax=Stegastes partitus TaxID=144197 RepID=A0A3B5AWK9_9TELE|nr:PREDICTED: neuronal-specific septin-3 isoform X1 [Stegastes partitus]